MTSSIPSLPRQGGFTFKQFFIGHDRCAMKVSTDGVLLGAWAQLPVQDNIRVLDIGTGSGLLAIMLAQRLAQQGRNYSIDAIDIDEKAVEQAKDNSDKAPWSQHIHVWQQDVLAWDNAPEMAYALIVCNPPYYANGREFRDTRRELARNSASLEHHALLNKVGQLLAGNGRFCVVLPCDEAERLVVYAESQGWYKEHRCLINERQGRTPHRELISFRKQPSECLQARLTLREESGNYSQAFRDLTADFYLGA